MPRSKHSDETMGEQEKRDHESTEYLRQKVFAVVGQGVAGAPAPVSVRVGEYTAVCMQYTVTSIKTNAHASCEMSSECTGSGSASRASSSRGAEGGVRKIGISPHHGCIASTGRLRARCAANNNRDVRRREMPPRIDHQRHAGHSVGAVSLWAGGSPVALAPTSQAIRTDQPVRPPRTTGAPSSCHTDSRTHV